MRRNLRLRRAIYAIEGLLKHYHVGKRIETRGPYKEMGKDLIELSRAIEEKLEEYQYAS